jgi:hypothetical protein
MQFDGRIDKYNYYVSAVTPQFDRPQFFQAYDTYVDYKFKSIMIRRAGPSICALEDCKL